MKPPRLFILACILASSVTNGGEKLPGNATSDVNQSAESVIPGYATAEQTKGMCPCKAIHNEAPGFSIFKTPGGKRFFIGSPAARQEVVRFLRTLKERETCNFPRGSLN
jgi:hypothetical protein